MNHFVNGFFKGFGVALTFAAPVSAVFMFYVGNYRAMMVMVLTAFVGAIIWHRVGGNNHEQP